MYFLKIFSFGDKQAILDLKMAHPHDFGFRLRIFFEILQNERSQELHESYNNGFSEKILIWRNWAILGPKWCILVTLDPFHGLF